MKRAAGIVRYSIRAFREDNCIHWAASLSFYTFFSLIPIIFLMVSIIGFILGSEVGLMSEVIGLVKKSLPYLSDSIIANLYGLIERRKLYGWFSVLVIIWCAEFVLRAIHDAMIPIFGIVEKKGFVMNTLHSWGVFIVATVVVIFSISVTMIVDFLQSRMIPLFGEDVSNFLLQSITVKYFIPLLVMITATSIILKMLAGGKIRFRDALCGGLFFAILWELAKHIFAWYVASFACYNKHRHELRS
ncbi:MAG: YihY/virulence factor BrkB family protein, partial [Thermodesulfobacteriota bacterium]